MNERLKAILEKANENYSNMTDAELQRLDRCKKCSKSVEADDFQGGTELYCPLEGYPCDMIIQCVYVPDNKRYD